MGNLFVCYPKCSTCKKAKKWLDKNKIIYTERDIKEDNPTKEELKKWLDMSGLEIKRFFNTSGVKYRELKLKDKLPNMSEDEKLELLSTDGMLIKRPIFISENKSYVAFKEEEWENIL